MAETATPEKTPGQVSNEKTIKQLKDEKQKEEAQPKLDPATLSVGEARTELSLLPNCKNFEEVMQLCNWVASSNLVPDAYKDKPADVFVAAELGATIGLKFMTAIQNIAVISGRPALPSKIKLAMVRGLKLVKDFKEASIDEIKENKKAWCSMTRTDTGETFRHTYSVEDAQAAGVWEQRRSEKFAGTWITHKWRMLQMKPRDMVLEDLYGDVFKGLRSVEEEEEIRTIREINAPETLIEAQSQPDTKGKEILEGNLPPLKTEETQASGGYVSFGDQKGSVLEKVGELVAAGKKQPENALETLVDLGQQALQEKKTEEKKTEPEALQETVAAFADRITAEIHKIPNGSAALSKVWSAHKLPMAKFNRGIQPSTLLKAEELGAYALDVEKLYQSQQSGK